jgi:hypothetical protein
MRNIYCFGNIPTFMSASDMQIQVRMIFVAMHPTIPRNNTRYYSAYRISRQTCKNGNFMDTTSKTVHSTFVHGSYGPFYTRYESSCMHLRSVAKKIVYTNFSYEFTNRAL